MARSFSGSANKLTLSATNGGTALGNVGNRWTIAARFKLTATPGAGEYGICNCAFPGGAVPVPYMLSVSGAVGDALSAGYYTGSGWQQVYGPVPVVDRPYHVVGRLDGNVLDIFVDGKIAATPVTAGSAWVAQSGQEMRIGHRWDGTDSFPGIIEDVIFWSGALTAEEILRLYNGVNPAALRPSGSLEGYWTLDDYGSSGAAKDSGPNGYALSMSGTTALSAPLRPGHILAIHYGATEVIESDLPDADTVLVDIQVSAADIADYVDAATATVVITPSGVDGIVHTDAATVLVDFTISYCEVYVTIPKPTFVGVEANKWTTIPSTQWIAYADNKWDSDVDSTNLDLDTVCV